MADMVDSCYSWIVVAVGFVVTFMSYGILRISGLIFSDVLILYNVDRQAASTPFLLGSVARSLSGPVSGYLSHTFGFRFAIFFGCFLSSLGIFACSFARDVTALSIFWTVYGFGYGMATTILPRAITLFNKKHASKATGIALSGGSLAGIVFPFLTVALLDAYGMPGTFLILSAILLNTIPGMILLREPEDEAVDNTVRLKAEISPQEINYCKVGKDCLGSDNNLPKTSCKTEVKLQKLEVKNLDNRCGDCYDAHEMPIFGTILLRKLEDEVIDNSVRLKCDKSAQENLEINDEMSISGMVLLRKPEDEVSDKSVRLKTKKSEQENLEINYCKKVGKDVLGCDLVDKNLENKCGDCNDAHEMSTHIDKDVTVETYQRASELHKKQIQLQSIRKDKTNNNCTKASCLQLTSVFWNPLFLTFSFLRGFCSLLYVILPTILVDLSTDKRVEKDQAPFVLLALAGSDFIGKACLGWITDGKCISRLRYASLCFFVMALSFVLVVWSNGLLFMLVSTSIVSVGTGSVLTTLLVLVDQYFEKDVKSMAMAASEFFLLPMCFATSPLIGYFRDCLGSYDGLIYTLSAISLICSVLIMLIPSISSFSKKKGTSMDI